MRTTRRVVVTGIGAVTGWGHGVDALWQGLLSGRTAIRDFERFDHSEHRTHLAAEVPPSEDATPPRKYRLALADQYALQSAREAISQANLDDTDLGAATGVYFGSSTGGMLEAENVFRRHLGLGSGPIRVGALTSQQYNSPGDTVARYLGIEGPVVTLSSACTSASLAIAAAFDAVRFGEVDRVLTGGSDGLCRLTYAGFNSLRAVASGPCRPFRTDREGLSIGDGGGVLVLEPLEAALGRGARPLAELVGTGSTCDAHHMTAPLPGGEGAARAIREALNLAGIAPEAIDFINAHGTGTPLNDRAESRALNLVFGDRAKSMPLVAPKGSLGHLLGSSGAVEAIATILCLMHGRIHPTPGASDEETEPGISLVLDQPIELPSARYGLSTNLAFGGSNAALIFRKFESDSP